MRETIRSCPGARTVALAALALVAIAGCGSTAQRDFTERDVLTALHLRSPDRGITYRDARGCSVNQILNTPEEVDLYRGAGDTVVSDDSNTVGVKAVGVSHACRTRFQRELNRLAG